MKMGPKFGTKADLIINEYPQEFADSIIKPSRSNHPPSDTIYHSTLIPYIQCIFSEKFRCSAKPFQCQDHLESYKMHSVGH
jgi:hypothetical protein